MIKNKRLSLIDNDSKLPLTGSTAVQSEGTDMVPLRSVAQGALNPTWLASQGHRRDLALTYYYNKIKKNRSKRQPINVYRIKFEICPPQIGLHHIKCIFMLRLTL